MNNTPQPRKNQTLSQTMRTVILAALILLPFGLYLALQAQNLIFAAVLFAVILMLTLVLALAG